MNEHVRIQSGQVEYQLPIEVQAPAKLPTKILAYQERAKKAIHDTQNLIKYADGIWGLPIGIDGFATLAPGAGFVSTVYFWWWLMVYAAAAKASFGTRFAGTLMSGADLAMGAIPGIGDVADIFFRAHHIFGTRIIEETEFKLAAIEHACMRAAPDGTIPPDELTELNAIIFRNGRDEKSNNIRVLIYGGIALLITYGIFVGG